MKRLITTLFILLPWLAISQTLVTGTVTDETGEAMPGINAFIENTFDGASTDVNGKFSFQTEETGAQVLRILFMGYEERSIPVELNGKFINMNVSLKESFNKLDAVIITAGAFAAGDAKRSSALTSLDMLTTAGAMADVSGAIQTLPGTTKVGESGRLFVRGGDADETNIYIDNMLVPTPYLSTAPNMPSRGRFNPFLFTGTIFSTGGYSAEYGQALSSVLLLNTSNLKEEDEVNISLLSVGADLTATKRWEKQSLTATLNYFDLAPYMAITEQNQDFTSAPIMSSNEISFKRKTGEFGMFKVYSNLNYNRSALNRPDLNNGGTINYDLTNINYFTNVSWRGSISEKWGIFAGADFQVNKDDIVIGVDDFAEETKAGHFKSTFVYDPNDKISLHFGTEYLVENFGQGFQSDTVTYQADFTDHLVSGFAEASIYTSKKFVIRPGVRIEHSQLLGQSNIAPRFSAAYKISDHGQFSLAAGQFYQKPIRKDLVIDSELNYQRADHYTFNYQMSKSDRIFRTEVYYKNYDALVKYDSPIKYNNTGKGYAYGLDVFFRDNKTIKDGHFWISYSYLQTERDYKDYPGMVIPTFASEHSLSVVYKHWFPIQRIMMGVDFNIASPRKYNNPNMDTFNAAEMPINHNLNMNIVYLYKTQVIFYAAVTNVLGRKNQYGYEYARRPNEEGVYASAPIRGFSDRFYVVGIFLTFSKDKTKNQLNKIN